jgi:hypothetical protein
VCSDQEQEYNEFMNVVMATADQLIEGQHLILEHGEISSNNLSCSDARYNVCIAHLSVVIDNLAISKDREVTPDQITSIMQRMMYAFDECLEEMEEDV